MSKIRDSDKFGPPKTIVDPTGIYCIYRVAGKKKVKQVQIIENKDDLEIIEYVTPEGDSVNFTRIVGSTAGEDVIRHAEFVKVARPKGHLVIFHFADMQQTFDLGHDKDGIILWLLKNAVKFGIIKKLPDFLLQA
jgi:hypothetical protein